MGFNPKNNKYHIIFLSLNLPLVFHFDKFQSLPPGEPREHHLGEVLQVRSKSKFNITLSYSIVLFFSSGFHNPNYLEIQMNLISKFLAPNFENISLGNFQTS